jgi:hypothetical protein
MVTPPALENISWKFYIILGIFNVVNALVAFFFFVETKSKSLEDIDRHFAERYHGGEELRQVEQAVEIHHGGSNDSGSEHKGVELTLKEES